MTVATRLRGAFALYIALLAALVSYHVHTLRRAVASGHALTEISTRWRVASTDQVARLAEMASDVEKFAVTSDRGYFDKAIELATAYDRELATFDTLSLTGAERAALGPLTRDWRDVGGRLPTLARVAGLPSDAAQAAIAPLQRGLERVRQETEHLGAAAQAAMTHELVASEAAARASERISWLVALTALVSTVLLSAMLVRSIVGPLERLAVGTHEVSAGRFGHRLDASGDDELAQVSRDFNAMTERLDELDRMKRDFVAKVSHDLKTPLSSMQETISALVDGLAGEVTAKQRQLLELNLESGRRLSAMLTKLLDLSRIEAGLEPDMEMLDLMALLKRSVDRASAAPLPSNLRWSIVEPSHRVLVRGDAAGLAQVVDNLLENAIKFSPPGGMVSVGLAGIGSTIELTVADEGPGIPDDEKERVFDRFYQTETGRAARGRGVGLGLTISREIVTAHGGTIWVTDNEPRGSVFHVALPGAVLGPGGHPEARSAAGSLSLGSLAVAAMLALGAASCVRPAFQRYLDEERWAEAARAFAADSSLLNDEHALYEAGLLYSSPDRGTYDPERARALLRRLVASFPDTRYRVDASDRAALLDSVLQSRANAAREQDLEVRIASLTAQMQRLRVSRDSIAAKGDTLQRAVDRMTADLRERDDQLRALRLELARLKAIDLKPRRP